MNAIDLTPLYRNSIGFDSLSHALENALHADAMTNSYPPYNIEVLGDNRYAITVAVAGFNQSDLDIKVEGGVLTISGKKAQDKDREYLHQGIASRAFERKFNLADYVEVVDAALDNGLLTVSLVKEIPEAMKPKTIEINSGTKAISHKKSESQAA